MSTNYANNSIKNRTKPEEEIQAKGIEKVTKGKVKTRRKSEMSKIASNLVSEGAQSIKEYVIYEVLIPTIKDTASLIGKGCIDLLFHGEVRDTKPSGRRTSNITKVSYGKFYDDRREDIRADHRRVATRLSYDDISFEAKEDADEVLDRMDEIVEQYGVVRVADLFELAGYTGNGPTDQNYGWTSTKSAVVQRDRYGEFYIKMNRPSPLR